MMRRELEKLQKTLGGVKFMRRLPQAIIVASAQGEKIALAEAKNLRIPTIGIVDTDADPLSVNVPIFGNDDSNKAVALIMTLMGDAIATAKGEQPLAAFKENPTVEGIVERQPRFNKRPNSAPRRRAEVKEGK
jgi:small subunit ribosomal protein S2